MKNVGISTVLVAALGLAASQSAFAENDGQIKIEGSVVAVTCTIDGQAPGNGDIEKLVDLRGISVALLDEAGKTGGDKAFTFRIGAAGETTCENDRTAFVRFDPASPAIDFATGGLRNTTTDNTAAGNVQVELANIDGVAIDLGNDDSAGYPIANNQTSIPLIARLKATGGAATAGLVTSAVGFTVVYE
ncbi:fimbrial protein [Xanthomonas sp. 60]